MTTPNAPETCPNCHGQMRPQDWCYRCGGGMGTTGFNATGTGHLVDNTRDQADDESDALREQVRIAREALEEYGQHGPACMAGYFCQKPDGSTDYKRRRGPCDCGLDEALAQLSKP